MSSDPNHAKAKLHQAWDEMIGQLEQARDCIDVPEKMPAPASDRLLAEGYRYLAGYMHAAIERAFHDDPMRPQFRNALSPITRATIDNADAIYFYTAIDGRQSYLLRGEIGDARHWRGAAPAATGRKAPHYLIFEASQGALAGDTGELTELIPGTKTQTGRMDSSTIEVDADGSFTVLFAPQRPADWQGNFVSTHRRVDQPHPADTEIGPDRFADYISGRQIFYDWDREDAIHFEIERIGAGGEVSEIYSVEKATAQLRSCGTIAHNQIRFWNAFWTILMGTYGERPGTLPGIGFKRNEFNQMNAAGVATGGGMSTNLYAGTIAELEEGEVLLVESEIRARPAYVGFQLGNLWGESLEYANRVGSRNGFQSHSDADGRMRWVVAHEDPGIQNWVDTSGHREVFVAPRWAFSETPAMEDWPTVRCLKIAATELRASLPADTPEFAPEQRCAEIAVRQRHARRRFRSF
jgi:hypothetical protein